MSDEKFFKEIDFLFETFLSPKKDRLQIRVKNIEKNSILSEKEMNYSKVFFDSQLNIYKIGKDGNIERVDNENFEAVVMRQE
jgi:hypothetical protein